MILLRHPKEQSGEDQVNRAVNKVIIIILKQAKAGILIWIIQSQLAHIGIIRTQMAHGGELVKTTYLF